MNVNFKCPSCGRRLAAIDAPDHATVLADRKCRGCFERWRLTVSRIGSLDVGPPMHKAEFIFLGRDKR